MSKIKEKKGITLIVLVIIIIVLLILASVAINGIFGDEGLIEQAKRTRFVANFKKVQELIQIYKSDKEIDKILGKDIKIKLPVKGKLTDSEINEIKSNNPTLEATIKKINNIRKIEQANLYWVDTELIGANVKHKYVIDIDNEQLYDYEGEYFYKKRWHTLKVGINEKDLDEVEEVEPEMWDGWITLTLYYPNGATDKMWRIGEEGEVRTDETLNWEKYEGPITVRLSQVENIWIKYKIKDETVIIPPLGKMLVNIEVDPIGGKQEQVKVSIDYDKDAELKQYRINGGIWQEYTEEFIITENVLIEAKGQKIENIYDTEGNLITSQTITGTDAYFIKNIGTEPVNDNLEAPTVKVTEDGKLEIIYPEDATEKYYKKNYSEKKPYTGPIENISNSEEIIIYYKTPNGKSEAIIYNPQTSTTRPYIPKDYNTTEIPESTQSLAGPVINVTTEGEKATITLTTAKTARKKYIKLGNQSYQEYTEPVTVYSNMIVYAYYISEDEGQVSKTSYKTVTGIHKGNKPVVTIDANPYPYGNSKITDEVTVTITTNATKAEYSFNGITYDTYSTPIKITQNCRIYARATNTYGTTTEYLDITNIGNEAPEKNDSLFVSIAVDPEPKLSTELTDKAKVTIQYDEMATSKFYSIGKEGTLQPYTEPFIVESNCTIYAYAVGDNRTGEAHKVIDNLTRGISEPIIVVNPENTQSSSKNKVTILFDRNAKISRYEIDDEGLRDYVGEFEVTKNCRIRAINTNRLGESAETIYYVENIIATPQPLILDKGDYYLLKLPFPENTSGQEYKYKEEGEWKSYPSDGIILIKPERKNYVLSNNTIKVKIENENGELIDFKGDWYILDVPISQLFEHIFMRWDRIQAGAPNIILNTTEPARDVVATIIYEDAIINRQYRLVYPDGTDTGWKKYKEPININKKGTIIYARGIDEAEVYSEEAILEVKNIDEEPPVITLVADLETEQQKVGVKVIVTDDTEIEIIKYEKGDFGESYFESNGTAILNNSVVNIIENDIYTFYAEDKVGNTQIYTLTVSNVDLTPPEITIEASPDTVGTESTITIDYGDSTTKQYKIGTNTTTWTTYTEPITITSYDVISAGAVNSDYTFTVYARGKDSAGNEIIESQKILNLDLDAPSAPIIKSNYGYPILTEYGVKVDGETTITYDSRKDITNYYSIDDGKTWNIYKGNFEIIKSGTIYAKSVKNNSGLEIISSITVEQPEDALGIEAYDGDTSTYYQVYAGYNKVITTNRYLYVDQSMYGKQFNLYAYGLDKNDRTWLHLYACSKDQTILESYDVHLYREWLNKNFTIPENTKYLLFSAYDAPGWTNTYLNVYEIGIADAPKITSELSYPVLTKNGVQKSYNTVNIEYFTTSVQRLYKIDDGNWQTYQNKAIKLDIGQTIYAKGIDKYGNETKEISSYTAKIEDALGIEAYDGDTSTYYQVYAGYNKVITTNRYLYVDQSMYGKQFNLYAYGLDKNDRTWLHLYACSKDQTILESYDVHLYREWLNKNFTIPENTKYLLFSAYDAPGWTNTYLNVYEIKPVK